MSTTRYSTSRSYQSATQDDCAHMTREDEGYNIHRVCTFAENLNVPEAGNCTCT